jgi:hypothetical protein
MPISSSDGGRPAEIGGITGLGAGRYRLEEAIDRKSLARR